MFFRKSKKEEEDEEAVEEKKTRRKKKDEEDEQVWDKKRILIGLVVLLFLVIGVREAKGYFFPNTSILGESTTKRASEVSKPDVKAPDLNLSSQVNTSLEDVKENVSNIDPAEVASSSPQIQKVLRDIQGIKNLPVDKARDACFNVCSRL